MTETEVGYGIVGVGSLGTALVRALVGAGEPPGIIWSRSGDRALALSRESGWAMAPSPAAVLREAELSLLTAPDGALLDLVGELARVLGPTAPGTKVVAHCAGARGPELFSPLSDLGFGVGVFHPLAAVPDGRAESLRRTSVVIEAQVPARDRLLRLAATLRLRPLVVSGLNRPLYHAAATFAAVLPLVLEQLGEQLAVESGAGEEIRPALRALFASSAANLERLGPEGAQSGARQRGDLLTLRAHELALERVDPELARLYQSINQLAATPPATRQEAR